MAYQKNKKKKKKINKKKKNWNCVHCQRWQREMKSIFIQWYLFCCFFFCRKCANFRPKYKLITTKQKKFAAEKNPEVFSLFTTCCNFANCSDNELVMNNSTNSIVFASLTVTKRDSSVIGQNFCRLKHKVLRVFCAFLAFFCEAEIVGNWSCYR